LDQATRRSDNGVSRRLAEVIMLQLVSFVQSQLWKDSAPSAGVLHDEFVLRAMTAFFSQPSHGWTVEALAREAGLSRAAFSERFRKAFEDTPLNTINRLRLQMAADMLKRSNASLADIAQEIGFGSAPAFLRAFTRQFGVRPGQWRSDSHSA
jgi:AraC-like DNA-binding protein